MVSYVPLVNCAVSSTICCIASCVSVCGNVSQPSVTAGSVTAGVTVDWRAEILRAVHDVFAKDLRAIHTDLRTYTLLHSGDGSDVLDALERTISAQVE